MTEYGVHEDFFKNSEFRLEKLYGLGIAVCFTGKTSTAKLDSNLDLKVVIPYSIILELDIRTDVNLSISCIKNVFLLKFSNKNMFFLHEIDKLTVVLMSIK